MLRDSTGGYLSSVAELRAPSPEAAAHYLDVAIAARASHAQVQSGQQQAPAPGSATLLYTLHIYQYAVDKSGKGGGKFILFLTTLCRRSCIQKFFIYVIDIYGTVHLDFL